MGSYLQLRLQKFVRENRVVFDVNSILKSVAMIRISSITSSVTCVGTYLPELCYDTDIFISDLCWNGKNSRITITDFVVLIDTRYFPHVIGNTLQTIGMNIFMSSGCSLHSDFHKELSHNLIKCFCYFAVLELNVFILRIISAKYLFNFASYAEFEYVVTSHMSLTQLCNVFALNEKRTILLSSAMGS